MTDGAPAEELQVNFVDIGVNLTSRRFDRDRDSVVTRAVQAGVGRMISLGCSADSSQQAAALAARYPGRVFATAGVHPHDAKTWDDTTEARLRHSLSEPGVVAVGECGLDFNRDFSPRPIQEAVFERQAALAAELGRPLLMHERDADKRFLHILRPYLSTTPRAVVHCFTGNRDTLRRYVDAGLYIGITGWICDARPDRGLALREVVPEIPLDRLLLETDAPYLPPRDLRPKPKGGRNEPALLPHIATHVADLLGVSLETLAAQTTANAVGLFGLPRTQETP